MTDLDERIVRTLRDRAEGTVDADRLLRASHARGRRRQLHRRVAAGTALSLIGALGVVGMTGTGLDGLTGRLPWTATTSTGATPVPPRIDGVPGAAADPALVGSDPNVLHFGLDPTQARYLGWEVIRGRTESVRLSVRDDQPVHVEVSSTPELSISVSFGGVEVEAAAPGPQTFDGTIHQASGSVRAMVKSWHPAPGLYARAVILRGDRAGLEQAVKALRWNEAHSCAVPLRLDALPEGAPITSCSVDVSSYPRLVSSEITLARAATEAMFVKYRYASGAGTRTAGNRTVAGRPAFFSGTTLDLLGIPKTVVSATFGLQREDRRPVGVQPGAPRGFTEADATTVLAGARVVEDPTRSESWE
ncbi:hypothetical protein ACLQ3D_23370 [Micromonospora vinacea]|uniref:Uncharacterized protein n=1 Tax=Micromonospora vinacea TaxID=709878 RepID=A0ABS0JVA3_9ACTN|nr:hypothetical protein [Micromonospora vinacea]MBG6100281.1 hypothetical protein [Micromonospora vinacea]WSZ76769.1 hypothetical protein OH804_33805 [Micromonospora sp. NBC_00860]